MIDSNHDLPELGADGRILEGIVTTCNEDGSANIAPMGPIVDSRFTRLLLRPFPTSTTYANLVRTGQGVFHVTDHVEWFAQSAVGVPDPLPVMFAATKIDGWVLADSCRWYGFEVDSIDASGAPRVDLGQRPTFLANVVEQHRLRDFFGFNRAMHAVIETAILATRLEYLSVEMVQAEMRHYEALVRKTGGDQERRAFRHLQAFVHTKDP
jgi:uncharacterized protein